MRTFLQALLGVTLALALGAFTLATVADSATRGCTGTETDHGSLACDPACNALGNCNKP